ncbi:MAG TPA: hypothetical protein VNA19_05535 [Pyrinomonadaceae bacterium]|nr:hypothetical protein [Pyrinomonadaceae bacterium]
MLTLLCVAFTSNAAAQHEHHGQPTPTPTPSAQQPAPTPTQTATPATGTTHTHAPSPASSPTPAPSPAAKPVWGDALKSAPTPRVQDDPHKGHDMKATTPEKSKPDASGADAHAGHNMSNDTGELMVVSGDDMGIRVGRSAGNLLPMGQMGSGTSWQPSATPMYMWHRRAGEWLLMFHGEAKIGVNRQGGPRGLTKLESQNWFMPMAFRRVGAGTLQLRGMFSLEPLTFSGAGSPQLFQTGEVYKGQPIIDQQHPHDLFMEMSAQYTVPLGERATWFAYVGFPGEPALGPVAFMHRASASENPTAPLSHHLQDSTHISFGVFTTGFTYRWLKLEGSLFNGREPDERRYNLEFNPWTSRSARVTVAPNRNWAFQLSHGLLKNPEQLEEGDVRRTTASIQHNKSFARGNVATSLIWGRNNERHGDEVFHLNSYTAESTVNFLDKNYVYTRLELVDKNNLLRHEDLDRLGFSHDIEHPQFRIGAYTFGAARDIWTTRKLSMALGGDFTFYSKPELLDPVYGRNPTSYKFFFRIRPRRMNMSEHGAHGGN